MTSASDFTVLIPARLASSRLPDKPLADIEGVPMVVRVARQAMASGARRCVVAADSEAIIRSCEHHGIEAILTRDDHVCGSDRLAQACELLALPDDHIVINVQGDEPLVAPELISAVAGELSRRTDCVMSTAAHAIGTWAEFLSPHVVKVVIDRDATALYFSRAPIPWWRDGMAPPPTQGPLPTPSPLRHIGLYGYRTAFLKRFPALPAAPIENCESLEQLRVLWHGHRIAVHLSSHAAAPGVDTPEDLERIRALVRAGNAASV